MVVMTLDEAKKVKKVLKAADGGCPYCVRELVEKMQKKFPEFDWKKKL